MRKSDITQVIDCLFNIECPELRDHFLTAFKEYLISLDKYNDNKYIIESQYMLRTIYIKKETVL